MLKCAPSSILLPHARFILFEQMVPVSGGLR
jgi:hypothetical protein